MKKQPLTPASKRLAFGMFLNALLRGSTAFMIVTAIQVLLCIGLPSEATCLAIGTNPIQAEAAFRTFGVTVLKAELGQNLIKFVLSGLAGYATTNWKVYRLILWRWGANDTAGPKSD